MFVPQNFDFTQHDTELCKISRKFDVLSEILHFAQQKASKQRQYLAVEVTIVVEILLAVKGGGCSPFFAEGFMCVELQLEFMQFGHVSFLLPSGNIFIMQFSELFLNVRKAYVTYLGPIFLEILKQHGDREVILKLQLTDKITERDLGKKTGANKLIFYEGILIIDGQNIDDRDIQWLIILYYQSAMMPLHKSLKSKLVPLLVVSCLNFVLAIVLVIAMAVQSFTGLSSSVPLQIVNCTHGYYLLKYNKFQTTLFIMFAPAVLSIFVELVICVLLVQPLIKQTRPARSRLRASFVLIALQGLASIVISGYFITFQIDFKLMSSCEANYVQTMLMILLSISGAIALIFIFQMIFYMRAYSCLLSQLNYETLTDSLQNHSKMNYLLTQFKDMRQKANNLSIQQQITNRSDRNKGTMGRQNFDKDFRKNQFNDNSLYYPPENSILEQGNDRNRQLDQSRRQEVQNYQPGDSKKFPPRDNMEGYRQQRNTNQWDQNKRQYVQANQLGENRAYGSPQRKIQEEASFGNQLNAKRIQGRNKQFDRSKGHSPPQSNIEHQRDHRYHQLHSNKRQGPYNQISVQQKYQNYIKRLNSKNSKQNESTLVSVIRGKYNH